MEEGTLVSSIVSSIGVLRLHVGIYLIGFSQGSQFASLVGTVHLLNVDVSKSAEVVSIALVAEKFEILVVVGNSVLVVLLLGVNVGDELVNLVLAGIELLNHLVGLDGFLGAVEVVEHVTVVLIVVDGEFQGVFLVEHLLCILCSLAVVLQLVVAVEGQTVEVVEVGVGLNTLLGQVKCLFILLHHECGGGIVGEDVVVELGNVLHFVVIFHGALQLVGVRVHVAGSGIYGIVGLYLTEFLEHINGSLGVNLLIYAGVLHITCRILGIELGSGLIPHGSLTGIVVNGSHIALEQITES